MAATLKFVGLKELQGKLANLSKLAPAQQAAAGALFQRGQAVMALAKRLVPVDTGTLRSTGDVGTPVFIGGNVELTLSFGGPAAPYALVQHEDLTLRHVVGGPKYLERPLQAEKTGLLSALRDQTLRLLAEQRPSIVAGAKSIKRLRGKGKLGRRQKRRRLLGLVAA